MDESKEAIKAGSQHPTAIVSNLTTVTENNGTSGAHSAGQPANDYEPDSRCEMITLEKAYFEPPAEQERRDNGMQNACNLNQTSSDPTVIEDYVARASCQQFMDNLDNSKDIVDASLDDTKDIIDSTIENFDIEMQAQSNFVPVESAENPPQASPVGKQNPVEEPSVQLDASAENDLPPQPDAPPHEPDNHEKEESALPEEPAAPEESVQPEKPTESDVCTQAEPHNEPEEPVQSDVPVQDGAHVMLEVEPESASPKPPRQEEDIQQSEPAEEDEKPATEVEDAGQEESIKPSELEAALETEAPTEVSPTIQTEDEPDMSVEPDEPAQIEAPDSLENSQDQSMIPNQPDEPIQLEEPGQQEEPIEPELTPAEATSSPDVQTSKDLNEELDATEATTTSHSELIPEDPPQKTIVTRKRSKAHKDSKVVEDNPRDKRSTPREEKPVEDSFRKFRCHDCGYSTDRLNNIVYHKKSSCQYLKQTWDNSVQNYISGFVKSPKSNKKRRLR